MDKKKGGWLKNTFHTEAGTHKIDQNEWISDLETP